MNDPIERQAAIDALYGITAYKNQIPLFSAVFNIEKLPSAQRWIPVTERLPEKHSSAIVTDFGYVTFAYTNNLDEWMDYDGNRLKNVTAWMPLPEPYRKEADHANANGG